MCITLYNHRRRYSAVAVLSFMLASFTSGESTGILWGSQSTHTTNTSCFCQEKRKRNLFSLLSPRMNCTCISGSVRSSDPTNLLIMILHVCLSVPARQEGATGHVCLCVCREGAYSRARTHARDFGLRRAYDRVRTKRKKNLQMRFKASNLKASYYCGDMKYVDAILK